MRKIVKIPLAAMALLAVFSCKEVKKEAVAADVQEEVATKSITFMMQPKSASNVEGEVTFTQEDGTVEMTGTFSGLTEGEHAIHLHETADCSSDDGTSTGGHWNPTNEPHGKWGDATGYHKGDIGNFTADADGNAIVNFATDQWCMDCEDENKNILGKAVIVHQGVDDFTSQPSGDAGARISCTGVIQ